MALKDPGPLALLAQNPNGAGYVVEESSRYEENAYSMPPGRIVLFSTFESWTEMYACIASSLSLALFVYLCIRHPLVFCQTLMPSSVNSKSLARTTCLLPAVQSEVFHTVGWGH